MVNVLNQNQKVIYGTDDHVDVFQLPAEPNLDEMDSGVALQCKCVRQKEMDFDVSTSQKFGAASKLCAGERFRDRPAGAFCFGFLVALDVIATAGIA